MIKISGQRSTKIKKNLERKSLNFRIRLVALIPIILFIAVIYNLVKVQFIKGDYYKRKASIQQTKNESIIPSRGTIYDSKGEVLAQSIPVDSVTLNPGMVVYSYGTQVPNNIVAEGLSQIFSLDYTVP